MDYRLYKLSFLTGVHFGSGSLDIGKETFSADTLFSALCIEAGKLSEEKREQFIDVVSNGKLLFSDAFPYIGDRLYLPKPIYRSRIDKGINGLSKSKELKAATFISADHIEDYLGGKYPSKEIEMLQYLGKRTLRDAVAIRGHENTQPYRVDVFVYGEKNGLYLIIASESDREYTLFEDLMDMLSYTGIGGEKSSGLGKFVFREDSLPKNMEKHLHEGFEKYMLLAGGLPVESDLERVLDGATYLLSRRRGFVDSYNYNEQFMRKRDLFLLASGSCVNIRFEGVVADVGSGGKHPVYRYAKPIFWGLF